MFSHHCTCGMHAVCSYESQFSTLLQLTVCVATGGVYQIIIHIPPPEPWLAMNFKRTFSLVQINHCSSLTTKRKSAYGKKRKRISGKFPLKHKKESLSLFYVWMWCLEPLQPSCCHVQLSCYLFPKSICQERQRRTVDSLRTFLRPWLVPPLELLHFWTFCQ